MCHMSGCVILLFFSYAYLTGFFLDRNGFEIQIILMQNQILVQDFSPSAIELGLRKDLSGGLCVL